MMRQSSQINEKYLPTCDLNLFILKTLYQVQAPNRAAKTRICSWQWDHRLGTKYATFTASLHAILNGYIDVVT